MAARLEGDNHPARCISLLQGVKSADLRAEEKSTLNHAGRSLNDMELKRESAQISLNSRRGVTKQSNGVTRNRVTGKNSISKKK